MSFVAHPASSATAPPLRGKKAGRFLLHAFCGLLFFVMSSILAITAFRGQQESAQPLFFAALVAVTPLAVVIHFRSKVRKPPLLVADSLVYLVSISGIFAIFAHPIEQWFTPMAFAATVFLRCLILFVYVPRSRLALERPFENIVLLWGYLDVLYISLAGMAVATLNKITPGGGRRLGETWGAKYSWMLPNNAGLYAALLIIFSVSNNQIPKWARYFGGFVGVYVLLITQSRMTGLSLFLTFLFMAFLASFRSIRRLSYYALGLAVVAALSIPVYSLFLSRLGAVQRLAERTERSDPTTGRLETFRVAVEKIQESPFVGHGYLSPGSRFENGYLSLGVEAGFIGLAAYLLFIALVVARAWPMLYWDHDPRAKNLARHTLVLTLFLMIRSFGERSHAFQVSDILSNIWMLLAGYLLIYRTHLMRIPTMRPAKSARPAPQGIPS